jgi:hypothetical protein
MIFPSLDRLVSSDPAQKRSAGSSVSVIFGNGGDSYRWDIRRIGYVSAEIYLKF